MLAGSNDWEEWIEVIRTKALAGKIWEFVNPSTLKASLPALERPAILMTTDVNPVKTAVPKLDQDEKNELKLLHYSYKHELTIYKWKNAALEALQSFIQESISRIYLTYMFNCETPYDMLTAFWLSFSMDFPW